MIPSTDTLRRAGEILAEIESLQTELAGLFSGGRGGRRGARGGGRAAAAAAAAGSGKRRRMSPEAKARIAAAAKARWARYRAEKKGADKDK